jgi:hypothetical protein
VVLSQDLEQPVTTHRNASLKKLLPQDVMQLARPKPRLQLPLPFHELGYEVLVHSPSLSDCSLLVVVLPTHPRFLAEPVDACPDLPSSYFLLA